MKPNIPALVLAACVLSIAGCSSTPGKIDTGAIPAGTFCFISPKPLPAYAAPEPQVHALVKSAITESLARRQVRRVEAGGDITVAYMIITGNNASIASIEDYFGYGRDASGLRDKAFDKYTSSKNPEYFQAGTLLVDIIDSKSGKVLKRGHATRALQQNPSTEQRAARMQEAVEEILAGVRFTQ